MVESSTREFQIGRSKTRNGLIIAGLCAVIGLAMILFSGEAVPDQRLVGALVLVLGLAVGFHAWRTGRPDGAHLRLDAAGVYFREWGAEIPWSAIADVYQSGARLQPFITLRIRDPEGLLAALPPDQARALRGNRLWKAPELRIPYHAVEASRDEVLAAIEDGLRYYGGVEK